MGRGCMMLRKAIIAGLTLAALGLLAPEAAQAHGPGHGWGPGWHHPGHWRGGFWPGVGIGVGIGAGWPYYDGYYDPYYGGPYYYRTEDYGGCYVARQRVMTPRGWRYRSVDVCE